MDEWKYVYREFSISGATDPHSNGKGGYGGILGIDPQSYDKSLCAGGSEDGSTGLGLTTAGAVASGNGDAASVKKEPPKGPAKGGKK